MGTDCKSALTVTGIYPSHLGVGRSVFFLKLYRIFTAVAIILSVVAIILSAVAIIYSAVAIILIVVELYLRFFFVQPN